MRIAIMGAGNVGAALGKGWARAGHEIVFGVIDAADPKHEPVAAAAGRAKMATVAGAAAGGAALVVLAVPWDAVPDVLAACGDLAGRLILDATNPLHFGAAGLELAIGFSTSGGEEVARLAPGAFVFKTMNQVGFAVMAAADGYPAKPVMFVAGDDAERKATVLALVADLGFEARDAGPLSRARLLEPYGMVWIEQAILHGAPQDAAFGLMRKDKAVMTIEYIRYALKEHTPQAFQDAYVKAAKSLQAAPECLGYELTSCEEDATSYILRIHWASTEAHLEGFRKGPHFPPFLAAIRDFMPEIAEMRHYEQTAIAWNRGS